MVSPDRLCFENVNRIAFGETNYRFFPVWTTSDRLADAAVLAAMVRGPDARDRHVEELLDRQPDLGLRRFRMHAERVLTTILIRRRSLLGDDRSNDGARYSRHWLLPFLFAGFLRRCFLCALGGCIGLGGLMRSLLRWPIGLVS